MQFYAFDILVSDGEDVRKLPLSMREANLARLLARRVDGIFLPDFEQARSARTCSATPVCRAGGHGLHRESIYRGGRSDCWIKVKI